jgi:predicted TIM-barrel fold metal-dependent hydrolase
MNQAHLFSFCATSMLPITAATCYDRRVFNCKGNLNIMKIIDAHVHLYDNHVIPHSHLNTIDPLFNNLLGDYSKLPLKYLFDDYKESTNNQVSGIVWHEFVSDQPNMEIAWAAEYLNTIEMPYAMVAKVDFSDSGFDAAIDFLKKYPRVTAIRQHMAYHPTDLLKRFTNEPSYFNNPIWLNNLKKLSHLPYKCGLEVFSNQLTDAIDVFRKHPDIEFTIALMGWPYSTSSECFDEWVKQLNELKTLDNICLHISALECIFGMDWNCSTIHPWIDSAINAVGIEKCMFGSHSPICNLSKNFLQQLDSYENILKGFSKNEKNMFFHDVAKKWFQIK